MDVYERILTTLVQEFSDLAQVEHITRATLRLVLAMFLGGLLGYERELMGKAAGMRTHMLVCLGAAIFVMALEQDGAELLHQFLAEAGVYVQPGLDGEFAAAHLLDEQRGAPAVVAQRLHGRALPAGCAAGPP